MKKQSLISLLTAAAMLAAIPACAGDEMVTIPSKTPDTGTGWQWAVNHADSMQDTAISARLIRPDTTGKFPVFVMMHGSDGIKHWEADFYGKALLEMGVGVLIVDSFSPRGIKETSSDQHQTPMTTNGIDAMYVLKWLSSQPYVDATRIGIMGWSRGGEATYSAYWPSLVQRIVPNVTARYSLFVPFFPPCREQLVSNQVGSGKMLFLLGESDDDTPASRCVDYAKEINQRGGNARTIVYPNSYHGFPNNGFSFNPKIRVWTTCPVIRTDIEHWGWYVPAEGNRPVNKNDNYACTSFGRHAGNNGSGAKEKSLIDLTRFVQQEWHLQP